MKKVIYSLYKGDVWLTDGTKEELASYLGIKVKSIQFYATPTHKKRTKYNSYVVVRLGYDKI